MKTEILNRHFGWARPQSWFLPQATVIQTLPLCRKE